MGVKSVSAEFMYFLAVKGRIGFQGCLYTEFVGTISRIFGLSVELFKFSV